MVDKQTNICYNRVNVVIEGWDKRWSFTQCHCSAEHTTCWTQAQRAADGGEVVMSDSQPASHTSLNDLSEKLHEEAAAVQQQQSVSPIDD